MPHDLDHGHDQGHGHTRGGHAHAHLDPASGDRRVAVAIWANGLLTVAQILGGLLSGSLALIADAIHNFSDMASLLIAFGARKIARRPADDRMTYGYGRVEIVAALINYTTLIVIGTWLLYEGALRLVDPPQVAGWTVVVMGGVALVVDTLTAALTYSMQKDSANIRALFLHNLSDALASVAVVAGGALILLHDWRWVDPVVTIGIAAYILYLALSEIGGPIRTLMLGTPSGLDLERVIDRLAGVAGVADIHHVHVWQMQEHAAALEAHVVIDDADWDQVEAIKLRLRAACRDDFGITHTTFELERAGAMCPDARRVGHS